MDIAPLTGPFALPTPLAEPEAAAAAEEDDEEEEESMGPERLWDRGWPPTPFPFCRTTVGGRDRFWKNEENNVNVNFC